MNTKKLILIFIVILFLFIPNTVGATVGEEFQDEDFKYKILTEDNESGYTVEITKYIGSKSDIVIQSTVQNDNITYTIKSIGRAAFRQNLNIKH